MTQYDEIFYPSPDGLTLYARDYNRVETPPLTILCLHGLTRNSADFEGLADHLSDRYRVIAADQRGRGRSDYDSNVDQYNLMIYVRDMWDLLAQMNITNVVVVGTSMGGLMAMMMALGQPNRLRGIILNDIGPEVDPAGVARIASYVGKGGPVTSWGEAVERIKAINEAFFPDLTEEDWQRLARASYREEGGGSLCPTYDINITRAPSFLKLDQPDLWPIFEATGHIPTLVLRGGLSDLLSDATLQKMQSRHPRMVQATVANCGHAPFLTEGDAVGPIDEFLATLEA